MLSWLWQKVLAAITPDVDSPEQGFERYVVYVKFKEDVASVDDHTTHLHLALRTLTCSGLIRLWTVEPEFPNSEDPEKATLFRIRMQVRLGAKAEVLRSIASVLAVEIADTQFERSLA